MYCSSLISRAQALVFAMPLALATALWSVGASRAETAPPPVAPTDPSTTEKLHDTTPVPSEDKTAPSLSEELEQKEGVITPPRGVDPEIKKPTPKDFSSDMPVIPPPGEPGGDQSVQPK